MVLFFGQRGTTKNQQQKKKKKKEKRLMSFPRWKIFKYHFQTYTGIIHKNIMLSVIVKFRICNSSLQPLKHLLFYSFFWSSTNYMIESFLNDGISFQNIKILLEPLKYRIRLLYCYQNLLFYEMIGFLTTNSFKNVVIEKK